MSVCFFNGNQDKSYKCTYDFNGAITINIDYDVADEVESKNGVKIWSSSTQFKNRDIVIADLDNHTYILVKNAFYVGFKNRLGSADDKHIAYFRSFNYLKCKSINHAFKLLAASSLTKIKVFSKGVIEKCGCSSVSLKDSKDNVTITLDQNPKCYVEKINKNNISEICIRDVWNYRTIEPDQIIINMFGYIELCLDNKVKIEDSDDYLKELLVYLRLYSPGKFPVDMVQLYIDDEYVEYCSFRLGEEYKKERSLNSVNVSLIDFLKNCYNNIPYRDSTIEIRNIPYIIEHKSHSIEDCYLACFRFIECYYKRTTKIRNNYQVINRAIKNNPIVLTSYKTIGNANYVKEIIALRNHYVHSGYYLKNNTLKITDKTGNVTYVVSNIDYNWLYERTKILNELAISILFKSMLGYKNYIYKTL